jgi:mevalonate kinase
MAMEKNSNSVFYGKIILFGEYGIIFDSMALTIPFTHFHGELSFDNTYNRYKYTDYDFARNSNAQLESFSVYLKKLMDEGKLNVGFDFNKFIRDLDNGLYFESSIPQGFGLGSSGALVAALYNHYAAHKILGGRSVTKEETLELKKIFSTMESFFHGKSSGIDPLNSYIQFPLLIKSKTDIETVGIPRNKINGDSGIFLINSGKPSKTEPLVNLFLEKCNDPGYSKVITDEFIPLNNACIQNLISGEMDSFFEQLTKLSALQHEYFEPMIPASFLPIWKEGLDSDTFNLKLCGSGGGGYLLGFTKNLTQTQDYFHKKDMEIVTVYKSAR